MKLSEIHIIQGPNCWSPEVHSLIALKIENSGSRDGDQVLIDKFNETFVGSSFSLLVETPQTIAGLIGIICLELQSRAGMACRFSTTKSITENTDYVIYEYTVEKAGVYAGEHALKMIALWADGKDYPLEEVIADLKAIKKKYALGATSGYILNEAKARHIPIRHMDAGSLVALGYGCRQKKLRTAVADTTSALGVEMAGDKEDTKNILAQANVPVPKGIIVYSEYELRTRIHEVKFPLVIKPLNGNHGRGVTTHIYDLDRALFGFDIASKISEEVIVEEFIPGDDHRFLVINYNLIAVARRSPAMITGDGKSTIVQLIEETNKDPQRGYGDEHVLAPIVIDDVTKKILSEHKLALPDVLKQGETLILKDTANISAGGTATDLTDRVHPYNRFMAERIARLFGLDICGVDIMTTGVDTPITRETGAVIEVNAGPGIRMHSNPQDGTERNVAAPIMEMLFPKGSAPLIPVIAVTGTAGKSELIKLIAQAAEGAGKRTGYNGSEGIFINGFQLKTGACTDRKDMEDVLFDPMIDLAILACDDHTVFSSGLPFNACDISIILHSKEGHTGLPFNSVRLKQVVAESTKPKGFAILNADDEDVLNLMPHLNCQVALISSYPNNKAVLKHIVNGWPAALIENDKLVIYHENNPIGTNQEKYKDLAQSGDEYKIALLAAAITGYLLALNKD